MSFSDPIGDMLTRIRNGQKAGLQSVECPASNFREGVLQALQREGYIRGYTVHQDSPGKKFLQIQLKVSSRPVIQLIKRVSKPGRRVYSKIGSLPPVHNGLGVSILSTSIGILSHLEAHEKNVGGEVLCSVF